MIRVGLGFNGLVKRYKKYGYAPVVISLEMTPDMGEECPSLWFKKSAISCLQVM
jgi:hypothetical protein